jgi:drug/metabolite transporter (DMT)-like permease
MAWIIPIIFLIIFEIIADIFAKEYSVHGTWIRWAPAIGAYVIANVFWLMAIRNGSGLARGAVIFSVSSAVIAVAIGLLVYKEQMGKAQILGVLFGIISLILIFYNE